MRLSGSASNRLDDVVAEIERETGGDPFVRTPFGTSKEGNMSGGWSMSLRRAALFTAGPGRYLFSKDDLILVTVPATGSGIEPLATNMPFGWDGKINESTAELAVWWAFEITSETEASEFMRQNRPEVIFSYFDADGPGEVTVAFNGEFWVIAG